MRTRTQIALAVIFSASLVAISSLMVGHPDPVYRGKRLHKWLEDLDYGKISRYRAPAEQAVRAMGTNALPGLVYYLKYHDSRFDTLARSLMIKIGFASFGSPAEVLWHVRAAQAFGELGTNAQPALPTLSAMASGNDHAAHSAVTVLGRMMPTSLPVLTNLLASGSRFSSQIVDVLALSLTNKQVASVSLNALTNALATGSRFSSEKAVEALALSLTNEQVASVSLNALTNALSRGRFPLDWQVATELRKTQLEFDEAVPALIMSLTDTTRHEPVRMAAACQLGRYHRRIAVLAPVLTGVAAHDPEWDVRASALAAVGQLAGAQECTAEDKNLIIHCLLSALHDREASVRAMAADGLGQSHASGTNVVEELVACLADPNKEVCLYVVNALREIDPQAAARAGLDQEPETPRSQLYSRYRP